MNLQSEPTDPEAARPHPRPALTLPSRAGTAPGILTLSVPFRLPLLAWWWWLISPWARGSGRFLLHRVCSILRSHWLSFQLLVGLGVVLVAAGPPGCDFGGCQPHLAGPGCVWVDTVPENMQPASYPKLHKRGRGFRVPCLFQLAARISLRWLVGADSSPAVPSGPKVRPSQCHPRSSPGTGFPAGSH